MECRTVITLAVRGELAVCCEVFEFIGQRVCTAGLAAAPRGNLKYARVSAIFGVHTQV
jgi:hypothetical protein